MDLPNDPRRYLDSHEWHLAGDDGVITVGLTAFAIEELTDITFVEIAVESGSIQAGQTFGEIESVKATSELYCGVSGEVVEVNQAVIDDPAMLNQEPFGAAWLIRVRPASSDDPLAGLLSADDYRARFGG
ncbi:MAG: glycine cleavage system protein GcvH [Planctomycetota bacterium]